MTFHIVRKVYRKSEKLYYIYMRLENFELCCKNDAIFFSSSKIEKFCANIIQNFQK